MSFDFGKIKLFALFFSFFFHKVRHYEKAHIFFEIIWKIATGISHFEWVFIYIDCPLFVFKTVSDASFCSMSLTMIKILLFSKENRQLVCSFSHNTELAGNIDLKHHSTIQTPLQIRNVQQSNNLELWLVYIVVFDSHWGSGGHKTYDEFNVILQSRNQSEQDWDNAKSGDDFPRKFNILTNGIPNATSNNAQWFIRKPKCKNQKHQMILKDSHQYFR